MSCLVKRTSITGDLEMDHAYMSPKSVLSFSAGDHLKNLTHFWATRVQSHGLGGSAFRIPNLTSYRETAYKEFKA